MEILKKLMITTVITSTAFISKAQNETSMQKAFSESYSQEYAKKYSDAISVLTVVYKEDSYEVNLRLGWLTYLNKNYNLSLSYYQKAVSLKP